MPLLLANVTQQVYQMARAAGLNKEDGSSIIKVFERMAGVTIGTPSSEESNANLMPTTFSQPAVRSLRNRLPIARNLTSAQRATLIASQLASTSACRAWNAKSLGA